MCTEKIGDLELQVTKLDEVKQALRRRIIKGIFSTDSFQNAVRQLSREGDEVTRDAKAFFRRQGVDVPDEVEIDIDRDGGVERQRTICVTWCTKNACYIYCAVLQH
jgi:hypothetical protein